MSRTRFKPILITIAVIVAVILINVIAFNGRITDPLVRLISRPSQYIWSKLTFLQVFGRNITDWRRLSEDVTRLKDENSQLIGRLALQEDIERENSYLRDVLNLPAQTKSELSEAGIFGIVFGPEGYRTLLNRGELDGVKVGSVVITPQGALVGSIEEVMSKTSRVRLVQDPGFEITTAIIGRSTVGIAKGYGEQGLLLELIAQGDAITEGDIVISSGADRYPGGLVIGTVNHVTESETSLFKDIRITPAFRNPAPMKVFFFR